MPLVIPISLQPPKPQSPLPINLSISPLIYLSVLPSAPSLPSTQGPAALSPLLLLLLPPGSFSIPAPLLPPPISLPPIFGSFIKIRSPSSLPTSARSSHALGWVPAAAKGTAPPSKLGGGATHPPRTHTHTTHTGSCSIHPLEGDAGQSDPMAVVLRRPNSYGGQLGSR